MIVIFGRPGSGKSTVTNAAMSILGQQQKQKQQTNKYNNNNTKQMDATASNCYLNLDLDTCIPQWMKDNFSKDIYPTLEQRTIFANSACDYVEEEIGKLHDSSSSSVVNVIVSFSFVNKDLRNVFRLRFPNAGWTLMDVTDEVAQDRINQRIGHFYKGETLAQKQESVAHQSDDNNDDNNSEWKFAPVDFPHVVLDGMDSIELNAKRVVHILMELNTV